MVEMSGMFGLLVAGRLVQTDFTVVSETEVVIEIPDADSINHVVLFLTGNIPFPEGTGGAVYIRWPGEGGSSNWHHLGVICNEKPSVIYKVAKLNKTSSTSQNMFASTMEVSAHGSAQLGIQVESLDSLAGKTPAQGTAAAQQSSMVELAEKLARWVVHYAESYAIKVPNGEGRMIEMVPLTAIHDWLTTFSRRFQQNPYFWRTLNYS